MAQNAIRQITQILAIEMDALYNLVLIILIDKAPKIIAEQATLSEKRAADKVIEDAIGDAVVTVKATIEILKLKAAVGVPDVKVSESEEIVGVVSTYAADPQTFKAILTNAVDIETAELCQ